MANSLLEIGTILPPLLEQQISPPYRIIARRLEIQLGAGVRQKTLLRVFAAGMVYVVCEKWFDRHRLEKLLKNCPTIPGAVIFV